MTLFDRIRAAAAEVASRARFVQIDDAGLASFAQTLPVGLAGLSSDDPAHLRFDDERDTLVYVLAVDAVNFGSGWFPVLRKSEGRSGYLTIATALRRHFEELGAPEPADLARITQADCARIFGQDPANPETWELMGHFARALRDLGRSVLELAGGSFEALVAGAGGRAERLVESLAEMPLYRDVSRYDGLEVPLLKRAQITVADLALVFEGRGPGRFDDVDSLTMFADNLVPHVLRCEGVLRYEPGLLARIDAGQLLGPGSLEEVEIRAVGLHAVERLVSLLRERGVPGASARHLDRLLWGRGQSPAIKRRNRHRTRSIFY